MTQKTVKLFVLTFGALVFSSPVFAARIYTQVASSATSSGGGGTTVSGTSAAGSITTSSSSVSQALTTTPAKLAVFTNAGYALNTVPDASTDQIAVSTAAVFAVQANIISTGTGVATLYGEIRKNGSSISPPLTCQDSPSYRCTISGEINLSSGDIITVYASANTNNTIYVTDAQLVVFTVGGVSAGSGGVATSPAGSNGNIQYNGSGSFAADSTIQRYDSGSLNVATAFRVGGSTDAFGNVPDKMEMTYTDNSNMDLNFYGGYTAFGSPFWSNYGRIRATQTGVGAGTPAPYGQLSFWAKSFDGSSLKQLMTFSGGLGSSVLNSVSPDIITLGNGTQDSGFPTPIYNKIQLFFDQYLNDGFIEYQTYDDVFFSSSTWNFQKGITTSTMTLRSLTSQNCLGTDSGGNVQAGTCGGGGYALEPATAPAVGFTKGLYTSTIAITSDSPGVAHVVAGSSQVVTGLVLSTEASTNLRRSGLPMSFDNGASVLVTSTRSFTLPFDFTLSTWTITCSSGSVAIHVSSSSVSDYKLGNYYNISAAGNSPSVASNVYNGAQISGWSQTVFSAGDVISFILDTATTSTWAIIEIWGLR